MKGPTIALAVAIAVAMTAGAPFVAGDTAIAKKDKALVSCPKKVGKFTLDDVLVYPAGTGQRCQYQHFLKPGRVAPGSVGLEIAWVPDVPGERSACLTRNPEPTRRDDYARAWTLGSPTKKAYAFINVTSNAKVGTKQVLAALRKAVAAAEPMGHPCVPEVEPVRSEGLTCPLLLAGDLVRSDWLYSSSVPPAIEDSVIPGETSELTCTYRPAYADEGGEAFIRVVWDVADPPLSRLCIAEERDSGSRVRRTTGHHPVEIEINDEFLSRWGGTAQTLADGLARAAAARTQRCPDAPDGPAPYEAAADQPSDDAAPVTGTTTTTIVLGGGPGEEPEPVGATVPMPEDDRHRVVIGGPDGEVIREESLGDQATIIAYGPMATDAEGNWSVSVEVGVSVAPVPASPAPSAPPPSPRPSIAPSATPSLAPVTSAEPTAEPMAMPSSSPAATPEPATPEPSPDPAASPTPVSPPELIGMPEGVAEIVAELPPAGAGAVRNLSDYLAVLGEALETGQRATVTIPPDDIGSLRELLPDLVQEVWLTDDAIVVSTNSRRIGSILVKPVEEDGLISVSLSRYQVATYHPVVQALVAALNGYVAQSGGRFTDVSVTPKGLTITAERAGG